MPELEGQIERVTFSNEENGYTVAHMRLESGDTATVVGILHEASPGSYLRLRGEWTVHPKFGAQFKVEDYESVAPTSTQTIEKYLAAGAVKGIGPVTAKMIVQRFGAEALEIMDRDIARLREVPGIGRKRLEGIRQAWEGQKEVREVMLFLQGNGVSPAYAARIYRRYGRGSAAVVKKNPYRLAADIDGIGFQTADRIAEAIGFPRDGEQRAAAGLEYLLEGCGGEGHLYLSAGELLLRGSELLGIEEEALRGVLGSLEGRRRVVVDRSLPAAAGENETRGDSPRPSGAAGIDAWMPVYPPRLYDCEVAVARALRRLLSRESREDSAGPAAGLIPPPGRLPPARVEELLEHAVARLGEGQRGAVRAAFEKGVVAVTGGPGTGKTTIIEVLARGFGEAGLRVLLAAPTGRAAKRMSEATRLEAKTIHRLLEVGPGRTFRRNAENPLDCDALIVDEISMVDVPLMADLLAALPAHARLVLVGDADQLPSVGPGNLLGDIIGSEAIPVARLTEVYRQESGSRIISGAYDIIHGERPEFATGEEGDFYFIEQEDPERVAALVTTLVRERIPARFHFDPVEEIQVLTPTNRGPAGTAGLNETLQRALNPTGVSLARGGRSFRAGDKVMQIRNNYDLDVFNGDIGRVRRVDPEDSELAVLFDGREVIYESDSLDELSLAYAVTVHKAQGSEFPAVVIPLTTQAYLLLQRNLLYTAVTRGKRLVVIVGSRKALHVAIRNDRTQKRNTLLAARLRSGD